MTLVLYIEPTFPFAEALGAEFMRQHPNVDIEYRKDVFANLLENLPRVLASDDPPDIARVTSVHEHVASGLLLNLDPYAEAYGWDAWPQSIQSQARVGEDGYRGSGSLYGLGLGYEIIGTNMPIAGTHIVRNMVLNQYVDKDDLSAWIFLQPGAVFNSPEALAAAEHFNGWVEAGYFQPDVNAIDYATNMGQFIDGEGLFQFNGNWESANLGEQMGDNEGSLSRSAPRGRRSPCGDVCGHPVRRGRALRKP